MRSFTGAAPRRSLLVSAGLFASSALGPFAAHAEAPPEVILESAVQIDPTRFDRIGEAVGSAIRDGDLPGAVVLVWHRGQTVYRKAFGRRSVTPVSEAMTPDTIFDLASLTKVVATAPAVMMLVEDGLVRLRDPVASYIPGFDRHGKGRITIEHLLTHVSGLRADFPLEQEFQGSATAITLAIDECPVDPPGTRVVYSDINFIVLAEIVSRVSGQPFDQFVARRLLGPLGMDETGFLPARDERSRIAPTEFCRPLGWPCGDAAGASMLRGTVHDPTARRMGGVAGHAGLFGTADDLARFGAMFLGRGALDDARVLAPLTVARMTGLATPPGMADRRGTWLGHQFPILIKQRRPLRDRVVRSHGVYWDLDLDRSDNPDCGDFSLQPSPPGRYRRCCRAPGAGRHDGGSGGRGRAPSERGISQSDHRDRPSSGRGVRST